MENLKFGTMNLPMTKLYQENPFPNLRRNSSELTKLQNPSPDDDMHIGYGKIDSILPYMMQDYYAEAPTAQELNTVTLENKFLKAVFLPQLGGRLWSLYDKEGKRDLIYTPKAIRLGDLALRNSWFAGGVEWNFAIPGHSPFTCSPLFCERITDKDTGLPAVRMYEWERKRQAWYEIIAYLPEDSRFLHVRMRIKNCTEEEAAVYWWSNIAVKETIHTRVLVDAQEAYVRDYAGNFVKEELPYIQHNDVSYSTRGVSSKDYFFKVSGRKFIAAPDESGKGLLQVSTDILKGRKLFLWGMSGGGRNWQRKLLGTHEAYIEIQAGLARTQSECLPMEAGGEWEWLELYGRMDADPELLHSPDWDTAKKEALRKVNELADVAYIEQELKRTKESLCGETGKILQYGSGWGALENLRREAAGIPKIEGVRFPQESISKSQVAWKMLLETGSFAPLQDTEEIPAELLTQEEWIPVLEKAARDNAYAWYHLGVMYYANQEDQKARDAFLTSLEKEENVWALRSLAVLEAMEGELEQAKTHILRANDLWKNCYWLLKDVYHILEQGQELAEFIPIYDSLPEDLKSNGRIRLMAANAYLIAEDLENCGAILENKFEVADLREGERQLSNLWTAYMEKRAAREGTEVEEYKIRHPMPYWLDYRMATEG